METYGKAKYKWLKKFLELPNGIPSHDTFYKRKEEGHGREETRYYRSLTDLVKPLDPEGKWAGLVSVGMTEYMRVEKSGKVSLEKRYYISSLSFKAFELAQAAGGGSL